MTEPLTILHTEGSHHWGGQESRVLEECRWMHEQGHRAIIVGPAGSVLARKAAAFDVEHYPVLFTRSGFARAAWRVRRLLHSLRPDVLNTHGNLDSKVGLTAAAGLRIPLVLRTRHSIPSVRRTFWNFLLYRRLCHAVVTTADCASQQLIRDLGVAPESVFTVPSGIRVPQVMPTRARARQQLEREVGIPAGGRLVGYVGRLHISKGLLDVIAALRRVTDRIPNCHLILVGEGRHREILQEETARQRLESCVHFVGHRDDPWPYFRAFDCHVLASTEFEAISQSLRQAMFADCPVVATRTGGSVEVVRHGDTGLLVSPGNPPELAEALEQVFLDPVAANARASRARAFVEAHHTHENMGRTLLEIYDRFLGGRRHA